MDTGGLEDEDVRGRTENAIAQLALQPVISASAMISAITLHGDAPSFEIERNDGDERLPPPRQQVPQRNLKLKRHMGQTYFYDLQLTAVASDPTLFTKIEKKVGPYLARICGKRNHVADGRAAVSSMTSRIDANAFASRGRRPYSSARM
jgi:hypothetical protein